MRYSDEVLEDIRMGNDIVDFIGQYTQLKPKGHSFFGLCPFHRENTPSFSVSPEKQLYYCFGCGATGNVYNFVMQMENYDFLEAINYLADRINYSLPELTLSDQEKANDISSKKALLYDIHKLVARHYYDNLQTVQGEKVINYLDERKISVSMRKKFGLGYSLFKRNEIYLFLKERGFSDDIILESGLVLKDKNNNFYDRFFSRIMFPIIDVQGRIIAFGGRIIDEDISKNSPKYLNSSDTLIFNKSNNLYGINFARRSKKNKEYILVEGYMDVISLHQAGFDNAVAVLGTAFNQNHAKSIKRFTSNVILLFDSDEAGVNAVFRAIPFLKEQGINIKVLQLKNAKDPDEYIKKFGKASFENEINNAKSYISFQIEQKLNQYNLEDSFQKVEFIKEVAKIIATLDNSVEREVFINEASLITNISFQSILSEVEKSIQNFNVIQSHKKYKNSQNNNNKDSKLEDAQNSILNILANDINIFNKIKHIISYNEFFDEPYNKLAKLIYDFNEQQKYIVEADLISHFDDINHQHKISKIFMLQPNFKDVQSLEKAINDQIKIIKEAHINKKLENIENIQQLNELIQQKKNIQYLYINL